MKVRVLSLLLLLLVTAGFITATLSTHPDTAPPAAAVTPSPTPVPTPTPTPTVEELVRTRMAAMSVEEKVWQMMYVFPQDVVDSGTCTDLEIWADGQLCKGAGGFVISTENMSDVQPLQPMLGCITNSAAITPFIGVDEEGGRVERLHYTLGATESFAPMYTYKDLGTDTAYRNAKTIAEGIAAFGFNQNFAPVADVWTNEDNSVIGQRAYSDDAEEAAALVAAAVEGFHDGGVLTTLKHFPGHGDTAEDSHVSAAVSTKTLDELRETEFLPFAAGLEAGADMVMIGHICLPAIDGDTPATLSSTIVTDLLRSELGFEGVIITDSFDMAAIIDHYDPIDAAVQAIEAGCDMILGADDPDAVVKAILERVSSERIDESVRRILTLKLERGLMK